MMMNQETRENTAVMMRTILVSRLADSTSSLGVRGTAPPVCRIIAPP
jgi:hypothetical protein